MKYKGLLTVKSLPAILFLVLFVTPFFWLKPGSIDIGGDSTRLYFYDPFAFLKNVAIYGVSTQGSEIVEPNYFYIPFLVFLMFIKSIVHSSYILDSLFNGIKLSFGFLGIYLILKELLNDTRKSLPEKNILAAIIGGLFYLFSSKIIDTWDKAILSHNQIFLNPIFSYLILKYLLTSNKKYAIIFLFLSVIFAPAFSITSAPPLFSFYPLTITFILIYVILIRKKSLPYKGLLITSIVFFLLQAFQLFPQIVSIFNKGSFANTRIFDKKSIVEEGVRYFMGVLPYAKTSRNILLPPLAENLKYFTVLPPAILLFGTFFVKKEKKLFLIITLFFLITFFLLSAKITNIGLTFYESLFYLPGFSMFRNFIGQWIFIYTFFYAIFLGISFSSILDKFSLQKSKIISALLGIIILMEGYPLLHGDLINKIHPGSENVRIPIEMDPNYKNVLKFADQLPQTKRVISFPFSDSYYQVLFGKNEGAYIGSSTISYLTNATDFVGYQVMPSTITEELLRQSRYKNYQKIKEIFRLLSIDYIFHNEDPRIYDSTFPGGPYDYVRKSLPNSQKIYKEFIKNLGATEIFRKNSYVFYILPKKDQQEKIFIADKITPFDANKTAPEPGIPFIDRSITKNEIFLPKDVCKTINCKISNKKNNNITVLNQVNPTKYELTISTTTPFILAFLNGYDGNWKVYRQSDLNADIFSSFLEKDLNLRHIMIDGYANAWYFPKSEVDKFKNQTIVIEMVGQDIFYISALLSLSMFVLLIIYTVKIYIIDSLIVIMRKNE